ncbi:MAG TPA: glycosyltransferase [Candidatus Polarisedimenticolia bacterium]
MTDRLTLPTCSVGVMAYNEERNIGHLLEALRRQVVACCQLGEIIVVASGCTDRTEEIVQRAAGRDRRIRLLRQTRREGKARAINLFLQATRSSGADLCVLQSGDTLPEEGALEALLRPMVEDAGVGMTGAHVMPVNGHGTFVGGAVRTLWRLHHRLAMEVPKMGELVAFRNVVPSIAEDSAVDEVSIESAVTSAGYRLRYIPAAIVRNKGPETISDFLRQRRRIHAGHLHVARTAGYAPSTMKLSRVARHFIADTVSSPARAPLSLGAAVLEAVGRALGAWDFYVSRKSHAIWKIAVTTKDVQGN